MGNIGRNGERLNRQGMPAAGRHADGTADPVDAFRLQVYNGFSVADHAKEHHATNDPGIGIPPPQ